MAPSLSVVVIGRNEEAYLAGSLHSVLAAAETAGGAEVVYVDSASTDDSVAIASRLGVRVLMMSPEWRLTPAAGRHIGFHHTSGDLVMFVDGDTVIERDWLSQAVPVFADERVVAVAGYLDDIDEQGRLVTSKSPRLAAPVRCRWLRGSGCYRRSAMEKHGGFNPWLRSDEEAELGLRLTRGERRMLQLPVPMGRHLRGLSTISSLRRNWRLGRVSGTGVAWRYACHAGEGTAFCLQYLRSSIIFGLLMLLLLPALLLPLAGQWLLALPFIVATLGWTSAVALKKRGLSGVIDYLAIHSAILAGLLIGALTRHLESPSSYPANAAELENH